MRSRALVLVRRSQCEQSKSSLRSHNFDLTDSRFSYSTHQHPRNAMSSLNIRQNNSQHITLPRRLRNRHPMQAPQNPSLSSPPLHSPHHATKIHRLRCCSVLRGFGASARLTEIRSVSKQFRSVCCGRSAEGSSTAFRASRTLRERSNADYCHTEKKTLVDCRIWVMACWNSWKSVQ